MINVPCASTPLEPPSLPKALRHTTVVTLGPDGTDASHAARLFASVRLAPSFEQAMVTAYADGNDALICAGFVQRDGSEQVSDCWVNLHFRWLGRMALRHCWAQPTKPMGIATRAGLMLADATTVALHPATEALAAAWLPHAARRYVDAKPLAAAQAAQGGADACIGSLDVLATTGLIVHQVLHPTMVWCLYHPVNQDVPGTPGVRGAMP
ncbi:hypothetical protein [Kitasatospora kifunensis]|uniref:Uncharacterized protein n=1 Tax=Kitasatospora kifunensis TaxID=58351 RepID=A0A7W7R7P3_KITKI|nr:hypothetical protein [Kitasatospora kifunensis]MBB4926396.1 hypothetical protein [Kitasatospora kifunensis]